MSLEKAKKIFIENSEYGLNDIKNIKKIHHGFTNESYLFKLKNKQKYQIRIGGCNDIVSRTNEFNILKIIKNDLFVYLNDDGDGIKKWINGYTPKFIIKKKKLLKNLALKIKQLHSTDISKAENILYHDYYSFFEKSKSYIDQIDIDLYKKLIAKYNNLDLVLSHNDINPKNMIYDPKTKEIYLIDYEWGRINNRYWDIANFYRDSNLKLKDLNYITNLYGDLDIQTMYNFVYITTNFAIQWTYGMQETKKIIKYRKKLNKRIKSYRELVVL
ncbi:choline kinase [Malacoplasma iowae]|uniref:choline kinase n=1 Tax=Malacoplasma iowae TaxID=2116 RepID=UPI00387383D1|nr:phosphotransferase [Malacoplasma iowae]